MVPKFMFCIDEIKELSDAPPSNDAGGNWIPIITAGWNIRKGSGHGVSGQWYYCNGDNIRRAKGAPPTGSQPYKVFSMFFNSGHGFWVLRGDATSPSNGDAWHRLLFDHDQTSYCSSLTNAGQHTRLKVQHPEVRWPSMLLPDIYHGAAYPHKNYGGLTGDLPIFLCLVAFSMKPDRLAHDLPRLMRGGEWGTHDRHHGRTDKRGVIVTVYAVDDNESELRAYEDGNLGKYFN